MKLPYISSFSPSLKPGGAPMAPPLFVRVELELIKFTFIKTLSSPLCSIFQVFFTKFLMGEGLAFGDNFWSPLGTESDGGDSHQGRSQMREDLEKLSAESKNDPYSKIRANFGVLSIKWSFLMLFQYISTGLPRGQDLNKHTYKISRENFNNQGNKNMCNLKANETLKIWHYCVK